jgi:hypothetical protein
MAQQCREFSRLLFLHKNIEDRVAWVVSGFCSEKFQICSLGSSNSKSIGVENRVQVQTVFYVAPVLTTHHASTEKSLTQTNERRLGSGRPRARYKKYSYRSYRTVGNVKSYDRVR